MTAERPYLKPSGRAYKLADAVYRGETVEHACERLKINYDSGRKTMSRIHLTVQQSVGREISTVFALRLIFDPSAETDLHHFARNDGGSSAA